VASNAERQAAYRQRKQVKRLAAKLNPPDHGAGTVDQVNAPGEDAPVVSVVTPPQAQKPLSLSERIFGKKGSTPVVVSHKPAAKGKGKQPEKSSMISTTLPTIIAGLVATYAGQIVRDPYKPCAPSKAEVIAVLGPLFEIIGRRVDIVTQAGEDATAIANSFLAAIAYSARAYIMYVQIKNRENGSEQVQHQQAASQTPSAGTGYSQPARADAGTEPSARVSQPVFAGAPVSTGRADTAIDHADIDGAAAGGDDSGDSVSDADKVAALFKRDVAGRRALGLLPAGV
jgi:hypothetical protein